MKKINKIASYYGPLEVDIKEGKKLLGVPSYDKTRWQEIPGYLYKALVRYEEDQQ